MKEKASSKGLCKMATVAMAQMMFEMPCGVKAVDPIVAQPQPQPLVVSRVAAAAATAVMKASRAARSARAAKLQALLAKSWDLNSPRRLGHWAVRKRRLNHGNSGAALMKIVKPIKTYQNLWDLYHPISNT